MTTKDDAGGPTEREIEGSLKWADEWLAWPNSMAEVKVLAAAYRREKAAREAAEKVVEAARKMRPRHLCQTGPGEYNEYGDCMACKFWLAIHVYDAIRAGGGA